MSLTSSHHDWPVLGYTALPVGPGAAHVLQMAAGRHMGAPGRSVSYTKGAVVASQRNAAVPPGAPLAETPDDAAPERKRERTRV